MKILSWNVRGLGRKSKRRMIKNMLISCGADIVILQETKKVEIERTLVNSIWGFHHKDWVSIPAIGSSGGLVII